jgi:hypothetical protein
MHGYPVLGLAQRGNGSDLKVLIRDRLQQVHVHRGQKSTNSDLDSRQRYNMVCPIRKISAQDLPKFP